MHAHAGNGIAAYVQPFPAGSQAAAGRDSSCLPTASAAVTEHLMLWCKARLSASAVPITITVLPQLPVSAGGKLTRGALPRPSWAAEGITLPFEGKSSLIVGRGLPIEPATVGDGLPFQKLAAQISAAAQREASLEAFIPVPEGSVLGLFREALGLPHLEPTESFFHAGGDSLAAAAVANRLVIPPDMLGAFPTAWALAAAMRYPSSVSSHEPHVTFAAHTAGTVSDSQLQSTSLLL